MRGKASTRPTFTPTPGITPACAGKSTTSARTAAGYLDHPRVCGEKSPPPQKRSVNSGSPPRVRGKVAHPVIPVGDQGITPACAGKSGDLICAAGAWWDHPRVCGEKRIVEKRFGGVEGITPACAGKRLKRSHSIGHFSYILCLFHSVLHRASASGGSRAGPCAPPCLPAQNAVPV